MLSMYFKCISSQRNVHIFSHIFFCSCNAQSLMYQDPGMDELREEDSVVKKVMNERMFGVVRSVENLQSNIGIMHVSSVCSTGDRV